MSGPAAVAPPNDRADTSSTVNAETGALTGADGVLAACKAIATPTTPCPPTAAKAAPVFRNT